MTVATRPLFFCCGPKLALVGLWRSLHTTPKMDGAAFPWGITAGLDRESARRLPRPLVCRGSAGRCPLIAESYYMAWLFVSVCRHTPPVLIWLISARRDRPGDVRWTDARHITSALRRTVENCFWVRLQAARGSLSRHKCEH